MLHMVFKIVSTIIFAILATAVAVASGEQYADEMVKADIRIKNKVRRVLAKLGYLVKSFMSGFFFAMMFFMLRTTVETLVFKEAK